MAAYDVPMSVLPCVTYYVLPFQVLNRYVLD